MIQLPANTIEVFRPETMNALLKRIHDEATSIVVDVTTPKGRAELKSLAFKIARTKTAIDDAGKKLVEPMKEQAKMIDAERKRARDELDALKESVRKPLTDWEAEESARQRVITDAIARIAAIGSTVFSTSSDVKVAIESVQSEAKADFGEHKDEAAVAVELAGLRLQKQLTELEASEKRAAEAEKARIEAERKATEERLAREAQERKEREERIAKEAAERATKEAEARAKAEADRVKAEAERAERERALAAEREAKRRIDEEKARADAERRHSEELAAAAERSKVQAENAARIERERIESERKAEEAARARREADKAHRGKILMEAKDALSAIIGEEPAKLAIKAIHAGTIPHTSIAF